MMSGSAEQAAVANQLYGIRQAISAAAGDIEGENGGLAQELQELYQRVSLKLDKQNQLILEGWPDKIAGVIKKRVYLSGTRRDIEVGTRY